MKYPVTGKIPSGLFLLTFQDEQAQATGMLASWVQQVSFDPVMVSVAIEQGRPLLEHLEPGKVFALHLIPEGDKATLRTYAKDFDESMQKANPVMHESYPVPIIPKFNVLVCTVMKHVDVGSHNLLCATIDHEIQDHVYKPFVHLRRSALTY